MFLYEDKEPHLCRFVYFDLGNVLIRFCHRRMASQAAQLIGLTPDEVMRALFDDGLARKIECGLIQDEEVYQEFCRRTGQWPDPIRWGEALCDIFSLNKDLSAAPEPLETLLSQAVTDSVELAQGEMPPLVRRLLSLNFPRGILSNVGSAHWNHCLKTFPFIETYFPRHRILSYQVGAMKPDPAIYHAAWLSAQEEIPDLEPAEVLFIDDLQANVDGARLYGLSAVRYEG